MKKPFSAVSSLLGLNGAGTPCANLLLYALLCILKLLRLIDGASAPRPVTLVQSYCSREKQIYYDDLRSQPQRETSTKQPGLHLRFSFIQHEMTCTVSETMSYSLLKCNIFRMPSKNNVQMMYASRKLVLLVGGFRNVCFYSPPKIGFRDV